jgi:hypothetical protein
VSLKRKEQAKVDSNIPLKAMVKLLINRYFILLFLKESMRKDKRIIEKGHQGE